MPELFIITGANGAGKSSFGFSYLPTRYQKTQQIFDGDKLFLAKKRTLYPSQTLSMKEAGRIANEWLIEYFEEMVAFSIKEQKDFIYEGHFPDDANWVTPDRFKKAGFLVNFIFLGLKDINLSALRVFERAKLGGHNVPPYEIERNFYGNLYQVNNRFPGIDVLKIIDTSESTNPKMLAVFEKGEAVFGLHHGKLPEWFEHHLPNLYQKIVNRDDENIHTGFL